MYFVMGISWTTKFASFKLFLSHALFRCTVNLVLCAGGGGGGAARRPGRGRGPGAPPPPPPRPRQPVRVSQGLVCRPLRGQELSGRLYAEHRSCREMTPLGNLHVNAICVGGKQWTREVSIISSIEQASCMGVVEHYRCFEAGPSSMDPLSCSEWHLFLIQCSWLLRLMGIVYIYNQFIHENNQSLQISFKLDISFSDFYSLLHILLRPSRWL